MTMITTNHYVLCASGMIGMPQINHHFQGIDDDHAKRQAPELVGALSKAGYHNFTLFLMADDVGEAIEAYSVERPEPIVTAHKPRH